MGPTITDSSVGGTVYFLAHTVSSLMSILAIAGFAPVNFTLPVTVPLCTGVRLCAAAASPMMPAATAKTRPNFRIVAS